MLYSLYIGYDAFSLPDDKIDEIFRIAKQELGVNYVKINPQWKSIEPAKGQYDWSKFDSIADMIDRYGLKTMIILMQAGNPDWAVKRTPAVDVSQCTKFMGSPNPAPSDPAYAADFLGNFTKRYKGKMRISFVELENEPVTPCLWGDTTEYLAEVDNSVYERVKSIDPDIKVCSASIHQPLGIGTKNMADDTQEVFDRFGPYLDNLDNIDCFSMHDYAYTGGTQTSEYYFSSQYDLEDHLHDFLADHGKSEVPVVYTECAYGPKYFGEELAAAQLAQGYLLTHAKGKAEGRFCQAVAMGVTSKMAQGEDFGMAVLGSPNEYRAGYYAFKTMRRIMLQYPNHVQHVAGEVNGAGYWAEKFEGGGKSIYVAFVPVRFEGHSTFGRAQAPASQTTSLQVGTGTFKVTTMEGIEFKASSDSQGILRLELGAGPVYIEECGSCQSLPQYAYSPISGAGGGAPDDNGQPDIGKCGDGTCDEIESANPSLCPADCSGTGNGPVTEKCGDGICDDTERQNPQLCPADCSGTGNGPGTGKCGDGTCDEVERNIGVCPQDCP